MDFLGALLIALIASFGPTAMMLAALLITVRMNRKLEEIHKATNSLVDRLVASTKSEAHAAGMKEGERSKHG